MRWFTAGFTAVIYSLLMIIKYQLGWPKKSKKFQTSNLENLIQKSHWLSKFSFLALEKCEMSAQIYFFVLYPSLFLWDANIFPPAQQTVRLKDRPSLNNRINEVPCVEKFTQGRGMGTSSRTIKDGRKNSWFSQRDQPVKVTERWDTIKSSPISKVMISITIVPRYPAVNWNV